MTRTMTSKERAATAFAHQEPDRVPVNYLAEVDVDLRLKAHFGLKADDDEGVRQALGIDFRSVMPAYTGPRIHPEVPDRQVDPLWGAHTRWIEHETGGYWDFCDFPLQDAGVDEVAAWPMPNPDHFDYEGFAAEVKRYQDYYVAFCFNWMPDVINGTSMLRNMEQVLVDLMTDDEACLLFLDRKKAVLLEVFARCFEAAKGGIDMLWMGEDLGTQFSPLISLDLFRRHIRPRYQPFVDMAKQYNALSMIHTCGCSSWAYDDFVEMGVSIVDTLQPEAKNMDPAYLKSHFGGRLSFHGCISTAGPLAYGTVEETVSYVRDTLDIMMPGGEYALAPTHLIQDNSPTENVLAMYEAAKTYGTY